MTKSATSTWLCGERRVEIHPRRPFLLGILNVTPDSFSDGGKYLSPGEAVRHGINLLQTADGLDVGGESTRPGALPVSAAEERKRVVGVLREIRKEIPEAILSIDTYKAEVALAALEMAGVEVINDVGAGDWDPGMWQVLENSQAGYICMHSAGRPREMQNRPSYEDVVSEVGAFLQAKKREWEHRKMTQRGWFMMWESVLANWLSTTANWFRQIGVVQEGPWSGDCRANRFSRPHGWRKT